MQIFKRNNQLFKLLLFVVTISAFYACNNNGVTNQPVLSDYSEGEQWVWKYKGVTKKGEVRSNGEDARKVVNTNGVLGIVIGKDTVAVADLVQPEKSETPKYKWPLEVGKKWKYEKNWTSEDGTTGGQSQDVEVLSFKEETVEAGTFMAYTIQYKGKITNSRGYNADTEEVWWYAPELKNFIKLTQIQGDFHYVEELIEYSKSK